MILTALARVPGGAHLLALPDKMQFGQEPRFVAPQIYLGWWPTGLVIVGAAIMDFLVAWSMPRGKTARDCAFGAGLPIVGNLAIFFISTRPANSATRNWRIVPAAWEGCGASEEYSHALNALLMLAALGLATLGLSASARK